VGKESKKGEASGVVGVDIGMKSMVVTSEGVFAGEISDKIRTRVEKSKEKFARKQKLNACLKKKGKQPVGLTDKRVESHVRNEAGRAINRMIRSLPANSAVAVERLNVKDMRFKSREMNRWLRASQLGFIHDRLKFKLDDAGIRYRSVQPAYSSQQCLACGYVYAGNRADQAHFCCKKCGFTANADFNASRNLAKRFGDDELNKCSFKEVKSILEQRFKAGLPVDRSATAGLELEGKTSQSALSTQIPMSINVY